MKDGAEALRGIRARNENGILQTLAALASFPSAYHVFIERIDHQMSPDAFLSAAIEQAKTGLKENGIPIGSVLVIDGAIVGRGHNKRVQQSSPILHAEMDCLQNAGRLSTSAYKRSTLYTTLSPCDMCSGAILLYKIPKIVIGENRTFRGPEEYLRLRGVEIEVVDNAECFSLMQNFIAYHRSLWDEDVGI